MPVKDTDLFRSLQNKAVSSLDLKTQTSFGSHRPPRLPLCSAMNTSGHLVIPDDETSLLSSNGARALSSADAKTKADALRTVSVPIASKELSKLAKRESLKVQKKHYRHEKKRATNELLSALKDTSVIIIADWLKVRGSLKSWTKMWCVLKPGLLILYKSHKTKSSHWVATVLLNTCEVLERPSKKDGFCFIVFHPLDQSIWATKGPKGETIGAITQPLPYSSLIFRAPSEAAGKCWMDALDLALHCSSLLMRTMTRERRDTSSEPSNAAQNAEQSRQQLNESDCERHFKLCGLGDEMRTEKEEREEEKSDTESEEEEEEEEPHVITDDRLPVETPYLENAVEELGQLGDSCQTEEVAEENKSIIWTLVKQVRPGMDLSKVVLPTFILEPRSFLDKLTDYYYHANLLSEAVLEEDPFTRMKMVVRWYLSGFYKKPKGLKKPYNPILGETFRCFWQHPKTGSRTFYIAEQISHHPPVSAFYVSNRKDGFAISGCILAKSKFYGNSLSAILDGTGRLVFLKRGEDYILSMPYAHCRGILIGTLTMEMGGTVCIKCEKTGYHCELEFKLKPFLGSGEACNRIVGKLKLGGETLATLDGHWDQEIYIKDKRTGISELFWNPNPEMRAERLHRWTVPIEAQAEFESEKLWLHVSEAIVHGDQMAATAEKCLLEDAQRTATRERNAKMEEWVPRLFEQNLITGDWVYRYADLRPWDPMNDVIQYENEFIIMSKTRHQTPIVHTTSITNIDEKASSIRGHSKHPSLECNRLSRLKRLSMKPTTRTVKTCEGSDTCPTDGEIQPGDSESSLSAVETMADGLSPVKSVSGLNLPLGSLNRALEPLLTLQKENTEKLSAIQGQLVILQRHVQKTCTSGSSSSYLYGNRDLFVFAFVLLLQLVLLVWFK